MDGTGYIEIPDSTSLDLLEAKGTISAFIKVDSLSKEFAIVSKVSSSSYVKHVGYLFDVVGSGVLGNVGFEISNGSSVEVVSYEGDSLKDSIWHHLAMTFSGPGGQMVLYIDGIRVAQSSQTIASTNDTSEPIRLGTYRWNVGGIFRNMTGDLDEVRIYNRVLSESEIKALADPRQERPQKVMTQAQEPKRLQPKERGDKQPEAGNVVTNSIGMKLVYIPAGSFMMGSRDSAAQLAEYDRNRNFDFTDEFPQHKVHISKGFWMGQAEVTQGQYASVMNTKP